MAELLSRAVKEILRRQVPALGRAKNRVHFFIHAGLYICATVAHALAPLWLINWDTSQGWFWTGLLAYMVAAEFSDIFFKVFTGPGDDGWIEKHPGRTLIYALVSYIIGVYLAADLLREVLSQYFATTVIAARPQIEQLLKTSLSASP